MKYFRFYFFFTSIVLVAYNLVSKKARPWVLLIFSYIYFWLVSKQLVMFLIFSTLSIHHFGLWLSDIKRIRDEELEKNNKDDKKSIRELYSKKQKKVILLAILIHVGLLIILKYSNFIFTNINSVLDIFHIGKHFALSKVALPLGISFYTMQAISYIADVYNEKIEADKNLFNLALYLSFFPSITEGPICRYNDTVESLTKGERSTYKSVTFGFQRILFGLVKKMVIADRLDVIVKAIFTTYSKLDGGMILLGTILYTIELYMDFSGTIDAVIGSAETLNVKLPENFRQPFFSKTISEFWTRWHITLGTFFRDYVFYPVSLSKTSKNVTMFFKKKVGIRYAGIFAGGIALFAVWLLNGIWHGDGWNYIFFGMYHFFFILMGNICEPLISKICAKLKINRSNFIYRFMQIIKTTIIVIIGEMFFRAPTLTAGINMFKRIFTKFSLVSFKNGKWLTFGIDIQDYIIVLITLGIILVFSIMKEKNIDVREKVSNMPIGIRWTLYYILILYIIIFGAYGNGYTPVDPIYAGF